MRNVKRLSVVALLAVLATGCASQESARTDSDERDNQASQQRNTVPATPQYGVNGPVFN